MLFDQFAGLAERLPSLEMPQLNRVHGLSSSRTVFDLVGRTALFQYPSDCELPKTCLPEDVWEEFFLPFPAVCVEDSVSAVFLFDSMVDQTGFGTPRLFVDVYQVKEAQESIFLADLGVLNKIIPKGPSSYDTKAVLSARLVFNGRKEILATIKGEDVVNEMGGYPFSNVVTALEQLAHLYQEKELFLFEEKPKKPRTEKPGRILRSHDRPVYTVLRPAQIRKVMGVSLPSGEGPTRTPHERRAHYRRLKSSYYTKKRGQRVKVPATWVGPSEAVSGNKRYRVLLDY